MRTVVIRGGGELPADLRELIARGSTSVEERTAAGLEGSPEIEADRILFWSQGDEPEVRKAAEVYAERERRGGGERVLFVSDAAGSPALARFSPDEVFVWPQDEDRLTMAFLTSA